MTRPRRTAALSAAAAGLTALAATAALLAPAASANADQPRTNTERFYAGEAYTGQFADPSVMRTGGRFYAVATIHGGVNLPLMTSDDLRTWRPRAPLPDYRRWTDWRGYNDAMPAKPAWAALVRQGGKRMFSQWAPSIARVGDRYVAAYSAARSLGEHRRSCIGLAVSSSPTGPFSHPSSSPAVCFDASPRGVIDPDLVTRPNGEVYLTWKQEGVRNRSEPALMIQRLSDDGLRLRQGSSPRKLMELVRGTWKGGVIENPSMLRKDGQIFLFYSGNDWKTDRYATGYATCRTMLGPCTDRTHARPLLASDASAKGPGGADAFLDNSGRIRLAYAAWDAGRVGPRGTHARMLRVATLHRTGNGLVVARRG